MLLIQTVIQLDQGSENFIQNLLYFQTCSTIADSQNAGLDKLCWSSFTHFRAVLGILTLETLQFMAQDIFSKTDS